MLATLLIVFREVIEAGLIVGIVLAATRGVPSRGLWVSGGVACGVLGACLVAAFAGTIGKALSGTGQELFNAGILSLAVMMLAWHNIWMSRHGRAMAAEMKAVGAEVMSGRRSLMALAIVVAVAVLREGSEVVLFLYGIAVSGADTAASMALGGALGVALGAAASMLMYSGLLRIPARYLFKSTSWLITLVAAGMAAQAVAFLQQAGLITRFTRPAWNTSRFLSDSSIAGKALHALVGYTAQPSIMQVCVYTLTLTVIFMLTNVYAPATRASQVARAA